MCVGRFTVTGPSRRIASRVHLTEAESVLDRVGLRVDPRRLVDGLDREQKTLVAIGRALMGQHPGAGIVVLDEPTRALPPPDGSRRSTPSSATSRAPAARCSSSPTTSPRS